MDRIRIEGGVPLRGSLRIGGAKNAALPLMCAALLTDAALELANVPMLADINTMERLLESLGVAIEADRPIPGDGRLLRLNASRARACALRRCRLARSWAARRALRGSVLPADLGGFMSATRPSCAWPCNLCNPPPCGRLPAAFIGPFPGLPT